MRATCTVNSPRPYTRQSANSATRQHAGCHDPQCWAEYGHPFSMNYGCARKQIAAGCSVHIRELRVGTSGQGLGQTYVGVGKHVRHEVCGSHWRDGSVPPAHTQDRRLLVGASPCDSTCCDAPNSRAVQWRARAMLVGRAPCVLRWRGSGLSPLESVDAVTHVPLVRESNERSVPEGTRPELLPV